jgi:hypothetical protein
MTKGTLSSIGRDSTKIEDLNILLYEIEGLFVCFGPAQFMLKSVGAYVVGCRGDHCAFPPLF